ncbi:DNA polymerase III subunit beta [Rubrivirga sp. IMCC43871]|uniref:DNA polymerase III subunit beta n=1 Tax=Rubrivirga sp. IMCC43871 TaxID=3391575 RepID=UPI00399011C9
MKFTASSADLLRALSTVNGAVPSKSTLPILECVLFERVDDRLKIAATDLEISIVQKLAVQFEQNGTDAKQRIAVPARRLLDTLRALPDLSVTVTTDAEFNVELTTDQGRYKMVGYDGGDYPALPSLDGAQTISADSALVKHAIDKTGFAASKDALRPAMMGVLFQVRPDNATIVATDGHRLVKLVAEGITAKEPVDVIVPARALALAAKAAGEGACSIRIASGYVGFDFGDTQVVGRLIEEQYPNYEAVIPVENEKRLTVGRDAMLAAVRRVALYSSSMTHQIRLALESDALTVSAEDIERASEAKERVLCDYDAEPMEIGFNSQYLQEVLSNIDGEDVAFEFSSPNRAGVVSPAEGADGEELLMLIMPVMLNTYA